MESPVNEKNSPLERGYVQVYTGNGKGKTTAALGLAVRAAGAGLRVFFGQFVKRGEFSELKALLKFRDVIAVRQYGRGFVKSAPSAADIENAKTGLADAATRIAGGDFDLVVLDEINCAVAAGLLSVADVLEVVRRKPPAVELVLTGRNAHPDVIAAADLVTEMREIRHYYAAGVNARTGIEK